MRRECRVTKCYVLGALQFLWKLICCDFPVQINCLEVKIGPYHSIASPHQSKTRFMLVSSESDRFMHGGVGKKNTVMKYRRWEIINRAPECNFHPEYSDIFCFLQRKKKKKKCKKSAARPGRLGQVQLEHGSAWDMRSLLKISWRNYWRIDLLKT